MLLVLISLVVFVMVRLIPGDPAQVLLGNTATPGEIARARDQWGLDRAMHVQYLLFVNNALQGNLGRSLVWSVPATQFVGSHLPATFRLAGAATLIAIVVSLPLGVSPPRRRTVGWIGSGPACPFSCSRFRPSGSGS